MLPWPLSVYDISHPSPSLPTLSEFQWIFRVAGQAEQCGCDWHLSCRVSEHTWWEDTGVGRQVLYGSCCSFYAQWALWGKATSELRRKIASDASWSSKAVSLHKNLLHSDGTSTVRIVNDPWKFVASDVVACSSFKCKMRALIYIYCKDWFSPGKSG